MSKLGRCMGHGLSQAERDGNILPTLLLLLA